MNTDNELNMLQSLLSQINTIENIPIIFSMGTIPIFQNDELNFRNNNSIDDDQIEIVSVHESDSLVEKSEELILKNDKPTDIDKKVNPDNLLVPVAESQQNSNMFIEEFNQNDKSIEKIILNVGGKKFNITREWLDYLHINQQKLHKLNADGKIIYFLDRDPFYFSQIIELMKECDLDPGRIIENLDDYSDQFIYELCTYKIIDGKYKPNPKMKLKTFVGFINESRHNVIIKIMIDNLTFETFSSTLSKIPFFEKKLKILRSNKITLNNTDPKIFRHILNLLRTGQICVYSSSIIKLLDHYDTEYIVLNEKKIPSHIVSNHVPHQNQSENLIDNAKNEDLSLNLYQTIVTKDILTFGSTLTFPLENLDFINLIYLCIDIPILKPTEPYQYIDFLEYIIVDHTFITYSIQQQAKILTLNVSDNLYLYPIIYKQNSNTYHQLAKNVEKKIKVFYDNTLIDIHRLMLPIFDFGKNPLPIKKMVESGMKPQINIKIAPLHKIVQTKIVTKEKLVPDIPLLNVSLLVNHFTNTKNSIPKIYLYERLHAINIPVQKTDHPIYDISIIALDKIGLINDFYFVILTKEDHIADNINKFADNLVEMEIVKNNMVISVMDTDILNAYGPLSQLGYGLPAGIYYHKFSALVGKNHLLRIKVKKQSEIIRFYVNESNILFKS